MARRTPLLLGSFLVWTLFVWVGRIRNALGDPALDDGGRTGPLLLALSFVLPAVVLGAAWLVSRRSGSGSGSGSARGVTPFVRNGVIALAAWTTGVWVVRILDIALAGDHEVGFVVVHAVLAVVSIASAIAAAGAVWATREPTRSDVQVLEGNAN